MSKKRTPPWTIFIACEGKNTEPIYLERIKEEVEDFRNVAITIYPDRLDDTHKSDPLGLIKVAKKKLNVYDEAWAVYDKDGYTKHQEAIDLANTEIKGKKVKIAFSSIAFEQWVLLHFERSMFPFQKSQDIIDSKFENNDSYFKGYSKSANVDIYPVLKDLTLSAIINARWLRFQQRNIVASNPIYNLNPYTNVDELIQSLLDKDKLPIFRSYNEVITISDCELEVSRNGNTTNIKITNIRDRAMVTNEVSIHSAVDGEALEQVQIQNQVINPGDSTIIEVEVNGQIVITIDNQEIHILN